MEDRCWIAACFALMMALPTAGVSQETPPAPPAGSSCVLTNKVYVCKMADFKEALEKAQTAAIASDPENRASNATLRSLVQSLGKEVGDGSQADLTFLLTPADRAAIHIGPSLVDLALLRVYRRTADGARGDLVWAEMYRGEPDMPWPAVTRMLAAQMRERLGKKG